MNYIEINDGAREKANEMINLGDRNYHFRNFAHSKRQNPFKNILAFLRPSQLRSSERRLRQLRLARPKAK